MIAVRARVLFAVFMVLRLAGSPGGVAAQVGLCDDFALLPLLHGAVSRLEGAEDGHGNIALDDADTRLLEDVIAAAGRQARVGSSLARTLDRIAAKLPAESAPVTTALLPRERRDLVRWHQLCGTPLVSPESDPGFSIPGLLTYVGNASGDAPSGREAITESAAGSDERTGGQPTQQRARAQTRSGSAPVESDGVVHATGLFLTILAAIAFATATAHHVHARDQRRARRYTCRARSSIRSVDGSFPAIIVDISQKGCKVQLMNGATSLQGNCRVWIGGCWRGGRIIWSNRHYTGVSFVETLSRDVVQALDRGTDEMSLSALPRSGRGAGRPRQAA